MCSCSINTHAYMYESTYIHTVQLTATSCSHTLRHTGLDFMLPDIFIFLLSSDRKKGLSVSRYDATIPQTVYFDLPQKAENSSVHPSGKVGHGNRTRHTCI